MPGPGHGGPGFGGGHHHRPPMGGRMRHRPPMGGGMHHHPPMGGWHRPYRNRGCCGCLFPVIGVIGAVIAAFALIF